MAKVAAGGRAPAAARVLPAEGQPGPVHPLRERRGSEAADRPPAAPEGPSAPDPAPAPAEPDTPAAPPPAAALPDAPAGPAEASAEAALPASVPAATDPRGAAAAPAAGPPPRPADGWAGDRPATPAAAPEAFEIALDSEDLGPLRLSLAPADGAMTVQMTAERPETLDLLRRNADLLARDLHGIGYAAVAFRFGGEAGAGGRGTALARQADGGGGPETAPAAPASPGAPRRPGGGTGLDLRI